MQDQPLDGDARENEEVQLEFYEQLGYDDQERLSEEMGTIENDTGVDSTFGESIGDTAHKTADPFMSNTAEDKS